MKALSIRQPWAYFILTGQKPIENRTWSTNYRGPLVIHAGLRPAKNYNEVLAPTARALNSPALFLEAAAGASPECTLTTACRRGYLLGIVDLVAVCEESTSPWFQGPYGWVVVNPRLIEPIPYKGRLGLFDVPDALLEGVL